MACAVVPQMMMMNAPMQRPAPNRIVTAPSLPASHRIYVGNIAYTASPLEVGVTFSQFGAIRTVIMMPNMETGQHKGFGFVEFELEAAALAAQRTSVYIQNRQVKTGPTTHASVSVSSTPAQFVATNIPAQAGAQPGD